MFFYVFFKLDVGPNLTWLSRPSLTKVVEPGTDRKARPDRSAWLDSKWVGPWAGNAGPASSVVIGFIGLG